MKHTRYFLAGLTILCVFMIAVTSIRGSLLNPLRNAVGALLVPIQSGINAVGGGIYKEVSAMTELRQALSENEKLQAQVDELTEENTRLRSEEQEYQDSGSFTSWIRIIWSTNKVGARIIAKDSAPGFPFSVSIRDPDGIRENMKRHRGRRPGGHRTDVGTNYATVRSIIDDSSQVRRHGPAVGRHLYCFRDLRLFKEGRLRLSYMEKDDDVKDGDMIVTSKLSGKFLPGILIGYATGHYGGLS